MVVHFGGQWLQDEAYRTLQLHRRSIGYSGKTRLYNGKYMYVVEGTVEVIARRPQLRLTTRGPLGDTPVLFIDVWSCTAASKQSAVFLRTRQCILQ